MGFSPHQTNCYCWFSEKEARSAYKVPNFKEDNPTTSKGRRALKHVETSGYTYDEDFPCHKGLAILQCQVLPIYKYLNCEVKGCLDFCGK